jgi:hypothetical protein
VIQPYLYRLKLRKLIENVCSGLKNQIHIHKRFRHKRNIRVVAFKVTTLLVYAQEKFPVGQKWDKEANTS